MTKETIAEVLKFRDDRNWKQFHNPKDLAISISLEASELLEVFQWSADDVICAEKMDKIHFVVLHGLQPTRLLCPWDSPGKDIGIGCHSLLQGIYPRPRD